MKKKRVDFEVNFAVEKMIAQIQDTGIEFDPDMLEEYKQAVEGMITRELAEREGDSGHSFYIPTFDC